ncbi:MAG: trimeric intracellular cation channel family protein [Fibrobacter sp.]|nr:trimeric intracellular cation channel family protein [Fibrobacteraceae bacterium]MCF0225491.1 trimeric intracellular cation channel family protein [Fibrobacter sp.]
MLLLIIDILGTFAFAISGAEKAVRYRLDWLGLIVLATVTGVGGGVLRDVMLGSTPPVALTNPIYIPICIFGAFIYLKLRLRFRAIRNLILVVDALGLGFFTAVGAAKANALAAGPYSIILFAAITAAGGGMFRDMLVSEIPQVLKSDFYATAALIGGTLFLALDYFDLGDTSKILITTAFTFVLRLYAMRNKLELPKTGKRI